MKDDLVIADTSSLIALNNVEQLHLLVELFRNVFITAEVQKEYRLPLPEWIDIEAPVNKEELALLNNLLDEGEASAIALALEHSNCTLLIDERDGRHVARQRGVHCIGVLGLLLKAKRANRIIAIKPIIDQLVAKQFRISKLLIQFILQEADES